MKIIYEKKTNDLYYRNDKIAHTPAVELYQRKAHNVGAYRCANTPEAVEPAHVLCLEMECNVIVERCVNRTRTESVGNCPKDEHPECRALRKAEKTDSG
jgi:hypothetical protein